MQTNLVHLLCSVNFLSLYYIWQSHIKTNEKAKVIFKFKFRPEYIRLGARILFRDGKAKGVGEVTEVFPFDPLIPR